MCNLSDHNYPLLLKRPFFPSVSIFLHKRYTGAKYLKKEAASFQVLKQEPFYLEGSHFNMRQVLILLISQ